MHAHSHSTPISLATPSDRVEYLKKVMAWTVSGLFFAGVTGTAMAGFLYFSGITILSNYYVSLGIILGSFAIAHYVAPKMVFGENKAAGFVIANVAQGIAMGYLLLSAALLGNITTGNPFSLIGSALMMTALTGTGLLGYVMSGPKDFSLLGGMLSALGLPMLVLMGLSFVMPSLFGGTLGIIFCGVFVVISAAGLLYQLNAVIHQLRTDQHIEGSYLISMGILVLFWNILTLLMSLSRD
jgi:FtsH-binding integral membrane protein